MKHKGLLAQFQATIIVAEGYNAAAVEAMPTTPTKPERIRFNGYFSNDDLAALTRIRLACPDERLADNLIVRAAVRAVAPKQMLQYLPAITAEDRRRRYDGKK